MASFITTQKYRGCRPVFVFAVWAGMAGMGWAYHPVPSPDWSDHPSHVRHVFLFPDNASSPLPDQGRNDNGTPASTISVGPYGVGWRDPDPTLDPPQCAGNPGHGAWDLGKGGEIRITVPVGNLASTPEFNAYRVRLQVNVVAYDVMVRLPSFSVEGYRLWQDSLTESIAFFDSKLGLWINRTWTATLHHVMEDSVTVVIRADGDRGSLVDVVEIYALAEMEEEPLFTALGTPIYYYRSFGIAPRTRPPHTWDDVDYYDTDGDGALNWQEYVAGTDPTDPESVLKITWVDARAGERPYLEWIGGTLGPTAPYRIEATPCLRDPDWQVFGTRERVDGINDWLGEGKMLEKRLFFRIIAP